MDERYQQYLNREAAAGDGVHPNGCFWCGGEHPSTICANGEIDGFADLDLDDEFDDLEDELDELDFDDDDEDYE